VNEEDQLRIISMQEGGDVRAVFDRLARGIQVCRNFFYIWWPIYHVLTFRVPLLRIRDVSPQSPISLSRVPDPRSKRSRIRIRIKNLRILIQKVVLSSRKYDPGRGSVFFPSRIPGSKKHRIRNTVSYSIQA
jgi:hypothetical protein